MKFPKVTLLFAALATVFVLTVSAISKDSAKAQTITEEVKSTPPNDINSVVGIIKKKKKSRPTQA